MKYVRTIFGSGFFIVVLIAVYWAHISYFTVDVVFYAALLDVVLAVAITAVVLLLFRFFSGFNDFEVSQLLIIWMLAGYALAISVPTVLDRSLSFYILEKLQQRGGGIRLQAMEQVFTKEYVTEHRLLDVRITEQLQSGTISVVDDCVRLTPWGEQLATFSRNFRQNFLPRQRLLIDEYTGDLTDPFRDSPARMDYDC